MSMAMQDLRDRLNLILSDLHEACLALERGHVIVAWKYVKSALEHLEAIRDRLVG